MARINQAALQSLLLRNVAEVQFVKRRPKPDDGTLRRMLCTNSMQLLGSPQGRTTLNYRPTTGTMPYDPRAKNLVIAWDILMQDYRMISMDNCNLVQQWPADGEDFWPYFNEVFYPMSALEKRAWMNT